MIPSRQLVDRRRRNVVPILHCLNEMRGLPIMCDFSNEDAAYYLAGRGCIATQVKEAIKGWNGHSMDTIKIKTLIKDLKGEGMQAFVMAMRTEFPFFQWPLKH